MKSRTLLGVAFLLILPLALFANGGIIKGTINYQGDQTGPIIIATLAIPPDLNDPLVLDTLVAAGSYEICGLADGTYFIASFMDANTDGFPGLDEPVGLYPAPILIEDGATVENIDFEIKELPRGTGSISGKINYTGAFSGEVHVYALGLTKTPFTSAHFTWGAGDTYSLDGLFGGDYIVVAFMDLNDNQLPDLNEPMGAFQEELELGEGEQITDVDITLFDLDMFEGSISGSVYYDGIQTGDLHVIAAGLALTPFNNVLVDGQTGAFTIPNLSNGDYHLFAYLDTDGNGDYDLGEPFSESYLDKVHLEWGTDTTGIDLYVVDRGSSVITGNVTYTGDVQGLIIVAALGLSPTPIMPGFAFRLGDGPYPYSIAGLAPGVYTVAGFINSEGAGLPSSIEDILNNPFGFYLEDFVFLAQGDTATDINFTLEDSSTSTIAGMINVPEGISGKVYIFSLGISKTPFMKLTISDAGRYEIPNVAAGKYMVAAFMDVNGDGNFSMDEPVGFTSKLVTVYPNSVKDDVDLNLTSESTTEVASSEDVHTPSDYTLFPNYPNPFNPTTMLSYYVPKTSRVTIKIYNLLGEEVATLIDGHVQAGLHRVQWNATDGYHQQVGSGIYICRMEAENFVQSQKLTLIR